MNHKWLPARLLQLAMALSCVTAKAAALPSGTLSIPLVRTQDQSAYLVNLKVGTPPQTNMVVIDTGSPFLGLQGTNSNWCLQKDQPCKKYGSYNNLTSSTAVYINDDFSNVLINHGFGDYIKDTIRTGGHSFPNTTFGMILQYDAGFPAPVPNSGLMGLTPICKNKACTEMYNVTFPQSLVSAGFLKRNVVSVYLGPNEPDTIGELLFGAYDNAKQLGKVVNLPAIDPGGPLADGFANLVNYSSISIESKSSTGHDSSKHVQNFTLAKHPYALLDTGDPILFLPKPVYKEVKKYFNFTGPSNSQTGAYPVDCKYRKQQPDDATLLIGFAKNELQIRIPFNRLITQLTPTTCSIFVGQGPKDGRGCAFGDPFFRSAYTIFNFEKLEISISNINYTNATEIHPV